MPLSGVIAQPEAAVTLVHHSVPYRVPYSDILPDDDTAEVLAVETILRGTTLTFVNVYILPASSCPRNCAIDFDALLEDRGDQMVLGDFNTHHPSRFSRTRDDRAVARGRVSRWGGQHFATPAQAGRQSPWWSCFALVVMWTKGIASKNALHCQSSVRP